MLHKNINKIIQESINQGVALKLLKEISNELLELLDNLNNDDIFNDSNPNEIVKFATKLNDFTSNVIESIDRCVKCNTLDEGNEMVHVNTPSLDPIGFFRKMGDNLYRNLSNGGIAGKFLGNSKNRYYSAQNKKYANKQDGNTTAKLKILMFNYYPNIKKQYISIDSKYSYIFSRASTSGLMIPMKIIGKLDEVVDTLKNAQGNNP